MFVSADRLFRRIRGEVADDRGASLVVVVALMAMGFIVAMVIASAALFSMRQNAGVKGGVQAFAAAEAGRDAVVSAFEIAPESCPATAQYTDDPSDATDPTFSVAVFATNVVDEPTSSAGLSQRCPLDTDKWVVLRSTGTGGDGSSTVIDAVYPWEKFRTEVAGGGLGYMDASLTSSWSNTSGDTVIKRGNFTCGGSTVFDGNVFVLGGNVVVRQGTFELTTCEIRGDLYASGDINVQRGCFLIFICDGAKLRVGGQVKTLTTITNQGVLESGINPSAPYRNIEARGNIVTNHSNARIEAYNGGSVKTEQGISTSGGIVRAAADIVANQSISAGADVYSYDGAVLAGIDITGGATVRAETAIRAGRNIDGNGARQADTGVVTAVGAISGGGSVSGPAGVFAGGDISTSGTVTAGGGDIHAGGAISGGVRTAGGSVLARGGISAGTVTANGGSIITNGALAMGANRIARDAIASTGTIGAANAAGELRATTGSILSGGDILGNGARTAGQDIHAAGQLNSTANFALTAGRDVLTGGNFTWTASSNGSCAITRDVTAGGIITIVRTGNDSSARCAIGGHLWAYSGGNANAASTLPSHGSSASSRSQAWVVSNDVKARGGWTANSRYRTTGTSGIDPTPDKAVPPGSAPGVPAIPAVAAPTVAAPSAFFMVLNEDPDGTWETFDDLQLRTTWVDLGTYTTWPGYTPVGPLSAGRCGSSWLGTGGYVRQILGNPNALTVDGFSVPADVPVVIDATQCNNVSLSWSSTPLRRDAVLLVNNVAFTFASFTATSEHHLAIVQVDKDNSDQVPTWNPTGDREPVPNCSSGQNRINMTFSSGGWDPNVNLLLYSPCGINGNFASSWRGHLYTHNDNVQSGVLTTLVCVPMRVTGVVDLPCDINDIAEFGNMRVSAYRLGDRTSQTED